MISILGQWTSLKKMRYHATHKTCNGQQNIRPIPNSTFGAAGRANWRNRLRLAIPVNLICIFLVMPKDVAEIIRGSRICCGGGPMLLFSEAIYPSLGVDLGTQIEILWRDAHDWLFLYPYCSVLVVRTRVQTELLAFRPDCVRQRSSPSDDSS